MAGAAVPVVFPDSVGRITDWVPLALSGGRTAVVTGGVDGTVRLWDPDTGRQLRPPITATPVPGMCAVAVRRLDLRTDAGVPLVTVHAEDDTYAGARSVVRVWNPVTGELVSEAPPADGSQDGGRGRADDPPGRIADAVTGEVTGLVVLPGPAGRDVVASTHARGAGSITWDPITGARTGTLPIAVPDQAVPVPTPAGTLLAGTVGSGEVAVLDPVGGGTVSGPIQPHVAGVTALCVVRLAGGRHLLATAGEVTGRVFGRLPDQVKLWDVHTGLAVPTPFTCHACLIAAVRRPSGGDWLVCATDEGPVRVFDPTTGTEQGPGFDPPHRVARLGVLRDAAGRVLVVTGDESHDQVCVGDPATGQMLATFAEVYPERMLAVPGRDGIDVLLATDGAAGVTLWDPLTGEELIERLTGHVATEPDHNEVLPALLAGPDGQPLLITGGSDGTLRRWHLPHGGHRAA